jgi:peptidoglycan/LPS O-acetylase OafA/YrhL
LRWGVGVVGGVLLTFAYEPDSEAAKERRALAGVMQAGTVEIRHKLPPLKALTSVRFFAAIYVVFFHLWGGGALKNYPLLGNFVGSGNTGVTFFFVLSGFILAYNYPRVSSRKQFWIARFARVYPVYFLSLCLFAFRPVTWGQPGAVLGGVLAFGLLQAWWPPASSGLNPVAWTLSVEAFFYAVFPFLLPWIQGLRRRSFVMLEAAYLVLMCAPLVLSAAHQQTVSLKIVNFIEGPFPVSRLNTFLVGVYCGVHQARLGMGVEDRRGRSAGRRWMLVAGAVGSAAILCSPAPTAFGTLRTLLLTYTYVLVILGCAELEWPVLTNHAMQMGGEISYGIYILQIAVGIGYFDLQRRLFPALRPLPSVYLVVLIAVAYAVFRWFEVPARLAIRRVLTGRPVATRPI